jgi:phospholipid/cholesterol/gamma-HCH transport system substrate-binding protein
MHPRADVIRRLLALGAFLAVAGGLTLGIALKIQGFDTSERYRATARFDDVTGLFVGDPVKLAGVKVGKVHRISLDHGRARVELDIDRTVRLPRDTTSVIVRWRNLIGQRDLYLDPGTGAAKATAFLPTDGSAVIERTTSAVDVGAVLSALGPLGRAVDPNQLNDIFTALSQALDGNSASIDGLLHHLGSLSDLFASRSGAIGQMLTDYSSLSGVLASRDQQIAAMVDNIATLSQAFTDNTRLFESALDNLAATGEGVDRLLTANEVQLGQLLTNLRGLTNVLDEKLPQLEQAFGGLPAALQALFSTVNRGNFLTVDDTCLQVTAAPCTVPGGYFVP